MAGAGNLVELFPRIYWNLGGGVTKYKIRLGSASSGLDELDNSYH